MVTAWDILPPADFRLRLRKTLLANPSLTLRQVAQILGITKQRVSAMVGRLNRPTCARLDKPAPRRDEARAKMAELKKRVAAGESAERVAQEFGISLAQAYKLGFRSKSEKPMHGGGRKDCRCWRCRKASGIAVPRARLGVAQKAAVLDLLAYNDPYTGEGLTQKQIAGLLGTNQNTVSRISRSAQ